MRKFLSAVDSLAVARAVSCTVRTADFLPLEGILRIHITAVVSVEEHFGLPA
jgi:hypothetical protein